MSLATTKIGPGQYGVTIDGEDYVVHSPKVDTWEWWPKSKPNEKHNGYKTKKGALEGIQGRVPEVDNDGYYPPEKDLGTAIIQVTKDAARGGAYVNAVSKKDGQTWYSGFENDDQVERQIGNLQRNLPRAGFSKVEVKWK